MKFPDIELPPPSAPNAVWAEYHSLCANQLEAYRLSLEYGKQPLTVRQAVIDAISAHRSVRSLYLDPPSTHRTDHASQQGDLDSARSSAVHQH